MELFCFHYIQTREDNHEDTLISRKFTPPTYRTQPSLSQPPLRRTLHRSRRDASDRTLQQSLPTHIEKHIRLLPHQTENTALNEQLIGRTMPHDEYQEHSENDCVMREVQCEHCRENFLFKDIATHHDNCNRYPIDCLNNECEQVIPRDELDNHLTICDFTQIFCEYAKYGCHQMLQIKDTVQHNEEFQLLHLQQKMSYMERQVTAMEKWIDQYDALAGYHLCLKGSYFKSYFYCASLHNCIQGYQLNTIWNC